MSGTGYSFDTVVASGDQRLDGLLTDTKWDEPSLRYSFPDTAAEYGVNYGDDEPSGLTEATADIKNSTRDILGTSATEAHQEGFTVGGFTGLTFLETSQSGANLRIAQTSEAAYGITTAWAYLPNGSRPSGDVWLHDQVYDYTQPQAGNYAHFTLIHELGHTLGLAHPHEADAFGMVPTQYDAMEYTVMSYNSYPDADRFGYTNGTWDFAQSYMMLDIAALQYMYGADFSTNSGNTVYRWSPDSGQTIVDGKVAIDPGGNKIFATIWDGGGNDTFNLSAYKTDMTVNLGPGEFSVFDIAQLAQLDAGQPAQGNIYNALLYEGNTASLIENVIAGTGDDDVHGNVADNRVFGGAGADDIYGYGGRDRLLGESGWDRLFGQNGHDRLFGAGGRDHLDGGAGRDMLSGGNGRDTLIGGLDKDILTGGLGVDTFVYQNAADSGVGVFADEITDFVSGEDKLDFRSLVPGTLAFQQNGGFSGTEAMVIARQQGADTALFIDMDADGRGDMKIVLQGVSGVSENDFFL
jgi:serralysin